MYHDLRLAYLHRHVYKFIERRSLMGAEHYLFECDECRKHGFPSKRLITTSVFWG